MIEAGKYYWDVTPEMHTNHLTTYCPLLCVLSLYCHLLFIPISHPPNPCSSFHPQHTARLYCPASPAVRCGHMTELSPGQYIWRWYSGLAHKTSMHSLTTGWMGGWNEPQGDLESYIFKMAKPLEVNVPKWLHEHSHRQPGTTLDCDITKNILLDWCYIWGLFTTAIEPTLTSTLHFINIATVTGRGQGIFSVSQR